MRLLLLTAAGQADDTAPGQADGAVVASPLPALELLQHEVEPVSLDSALHAVLARESEAGLAPNAILIDGTTSPLAARTAAIALSGRVSAPRLAILNDAALAALTPEWSVADVVLPHASPAEVDARLRLLESRHSLAHPDSTQHAAVEEAGVEIDESNFVAKVHGRTLDLTYKEFELLHFLALNPARVFTRDHLLAEVWGSDYFGGTRTVDVHVRRLRAKLGDHEWLISTVRGVGYGFARGRQDNE